MVKFELQAAGGRSLNTYQGDYMKQTGEYVTIFKRATNPSLADEQVAAIRLDKGQSVKQIS
jgi:hypothetical protein